MTFGGRDLLGRLGGALLAPLIGTVSAARRARMFHPRGITVRALVRSCGGEVPWSVLGARLDGPALVRLSSAWWTTREWKDVLGIALRFTRAIRADGGSGPGDQDLLLATVRRPWTTPLAPLSTDPHDFLANDYYAVSPFRTDAGVVEWRLVPDRAAPPDGRDREARLARALARGEAALWLEARRYRRVIDVLVPGRPDRHRWRRVARIELIEPVDVDQRRLRFDPFRVGRGIAPIGLVHSLRRATYAASQWARGSVRTSRRVQRAEARAQREIASAE